MRSNSLISFSMKYPKRVTAIMIIVTLIMASLMVRIKVDTDPENMLSEDEAVRVFHDKVKKEFALHDMVVVGIVNDKHRNGIFNVESLKKVHDLSKFASTLQSKDGKKKVLSEYLISPGNVDSIEQAGKGQVRFDWLMKKPPKTEEEALKIKKLTMSNPLYKGTMVSEDEKAIAIYIPVSKKDFSYEVRKKVLERVKGYSGDEKYYITGLPVAEDTFGVEMFVQMAISAPLAMLAIFILMLLFFKSIKLIISPMIIALFTVLITMGLLIGSGFTVHIMSSMIPIFLMPIAVVDSVHIISEFYDRYDPKIGKKKTIEGVMHHLFKPMLFTSLTSVAGFISLVVTPIPPVQVFGVFVAFGIMLAWFLTIVFVPAYVMMLDEDKISNIKSDDSHVKDSFLAKLLKKTSFITYERAKLLIVGALVLSAVSVWGITKIEVNDNPVKWFREGHDLRISDRVLNSHFGGTYGAYLILEGKNDSKTIKEISELIISKIKDEKVKEIIAPSFREIAGKEGDEKKFFSALESKIEELSDGDISDELYDKLMAVSDILGAVKNRSEIFKEPEYLNYLSKLEEHIVSIDVVGKSNSLSDVVKKVYMELYEGKSEYYRIPDTKNGVTQTLISFQNSHKPEDLFHFVTPKYNKAALWIQLSNGDNKYMEKVVKDVSEYMKNNPPPSELKVGWAGLTYLNTVWQDKMVGGMINSFLSSFVVVFIMMSLLFRSPLWGAVAMIPLSVTILFIYGIIGFVGKDYDMPIAVLSSLTLGLAVDFAIHFIQRIREIYEIKGDLKETFVELYEEPARAISRNIIVIAVGFTPLLFAPLVPYQSVGILLAAIMFISGFATIILLPATVKAARGILFRNESKNSA